ncbi:hypothetical protein H072_6235 [Dactylellina haptotyla CBS 200.50]|uniref:FAD-binding FR-type domain-containing protein n=1 Tax=Dactylellina haptotyla (strain CBS 200.50) TaxID=1284197 RepID=S8BKA4_DACHA|nr:hypothetical protein H072_6235 [Dactylellina haptotyla CBS 200.50]
MASTIQALWSRAEAAGSRNSAGGPGGNSTNTSSSSHGGGMTPAQLTAFRHWMSLVNADLMRWYGLSLCVLIFFFILFHVSRTFMHLQGRRGMMGKMVAAPFRAFRKIALRKMPKFTSNGHFALIATYTGLNVFFAVYRTGFGGIYGTGFIAKRCAWLALCNLALVFLLAMKNNPIAFITGYSHERLNVLHRWAGRFVWVQASIHVCLATRLRQEDHTYRAGLTAWLFFSILFFCSFAFIRRRAYEYFFIVHIVCALGAAAALGFHEPKTYGMVLYLASGMWIFDRLVRFFRGVHYSKGTKATIYPLPGDAVKVVLNKSATFQPASHGFINIPSLKLFQSHPFTISSANSLEFIVRAQRGFTRKLYDRAVQNPGQSLQCYFDGPYGNVPDYRRMNRVILFAGGSGGSFSFAIATDIVRNLKRCCVESIEFVWVIREKSHSKWFEKELEELRNCPVVNLRIFVTREPSDLVNTHPESPTNGTAEDLHRSLPIHDSTESGLTIDEKPGSSSGVHSNDILSVPEKALELTIDTRIKPLSRSGSVGSMSPCYFESGRPDMDAIVKEATRNANQHDLIAVGACGPTELMRRARNATAAAITTSGASISLHCEQFGWG